MEKEAIVWLALFVIFLIIELATVGLTSIWLAGGALVALLLQMAGAGLVWQIGSFIVVSFLLLYFTRPFAVKYVNAHHEKTNYERAVGKTIKITERVDDLAQTGKGILDGTDGTWNYIDTGDIDTGSECPDRAAGTCVHSGTSGRL